MCCGEMKCSSLVTESVSYFPVCVQHYTTLLSKNFYPENMHFFQSLCQYRKQHKKSSISHNNQGDSKVKLTINTEVAANTTTDVESISLAFNSYIELFYSLRIIHLER